jgi:glycerol uptake facilitator-like aquaporin
MLGICAITDARNINIRLDLVPAYVAGLVMVIGMAFGHNCGYPLNPARDLSPRLFMLVSGWGVEAFR